MATDAAAISAELSAGLSAGVSTPGSEATNGDSQSGGLVQSVDRALSILEVLARDGEAGVTEIAADLGVHKSTAFRLLATLEAHRLVEQDGERGRYRLGVGNLRLAGATTARLDLVQEARPVCRQLASETGETVNITVRAETSALYLDQVAGSSALQSHNWVGQHIPLHATSNGKVLLSELEDAQLKKAVRELPRYTDQTVTTMSKLVAELAHVREQGYALAVDELETGLTAVAAPIRNAHGDVIASISVSGPSFRLTADRLDRAIPLLLAAALEVSHRLGWGQRE
ncbi:IclR family transcriptional regulator [Nocardioides islandensis]|jgi:DNA-binding IclR family transcriptional regulator|uniref:Glycerol operon regulatory protein n=1 Tax=Nocardioides islandensis TaxID=433663 RepID=A0A930VCP3_9ACTN|nr:IclR family transcriptional regulator [Nocardioides islandensis]MBF4762141.1 IclR family transcriptional regulator [Nocardioides islandensis]